MSAQSELVFLVDSDNTLDPQDLLRILEYADRYDLVCGARMRRQDPLYRILLSRGYNLLVWAIFGIYVGDINCGFKLMRRGVVENIVPEVRHLKNGFSTELVIRVHAMGKSVKVVPVKHFRRMHGVADQFTIQRIPRVVYQTLIGFARLKSELSLHYNVKSTRR
jgi:glycosyltransferase involved in cell wall biosynthesis